MERNRRYRIEGIRVASHLNSPSFLPSFLFPRAEQYMRKDWLFLLSLHKTNLYFILVKECLYSDGNMLFLKEGGKHFSVEDIRRNSLVRAGHCASGEV